MALFVKAAIVTLAIEHNTAIFNRQTKNFLVLVSRSCVKPLLIVHLPTALTTSSSVTNEQPLGIFSTLGSRTTYSLFTTVTPTYAIFVAPYGRHHRKD
jgi:hypothetical protein